MSPGGDSHMCWCGFPHVTCLFGRIMTETWFLTEGAGWCVLAMGDASSGEFFE